MRPQTDRISISNALLALKCPNGTKAMAARKTLGQAPIEEQVSKGIRALWKAKVRGHLKDRPGIRFAEVIHSDRIEGTLDAIEEVPNKGLNIFIFSTSRNEEYLTEKMTLLANLVEASGRIFRQGWVVSPNPDFGWEVSGDAKSLFMLEELSPSLTLRNELHERLKALGDSLQDSCQGTRRSGDHCKNLRCPEISACHKKEPGHIATLPRIGKKRAVLESMGIELIRDIPSNFPLTPHQEAVAEVVRNGKPSVNREKIFDFFRGIQYPVSYFDVESISSPFPPFQNTKPNQRLVFQYSLDVEAAPGGFLTHHEFLPEGGGDPRRELVAALLEALPSSGSVVVYHASFERGVLQELAEAFPGFAKELLAIIPRMIDLELPFSSRWYCNPGFQGSSSLKKVYPVLCPRESQYSELSIRDGEQASSVYLGFVHGILSQTEYQAFRRDLLAYCRLDTQSMVAILGRLRKIISTRDKN